MNFFEIFDNFHLFISPEWNFCNFSDFQSTLANTLMQFSKKSESKNFDKNHWILPRLGYRLSYRLGYILDYGLGYRLGYMLGNRQLLYMLLTIAPPGWKSESYVQEIKMSCTFQEFEFSNIQIWNFSKSWRVDEEFWWKYQNCLFRSIEMKILIFWIFEVLEMSWRPRYSRSSSLTYHKNPNLGFPSSNETKINCFE